jgi:hypothetical protein
VADRYPRPVRKFIDESTDDHPADEDKAAMNWVVAVSDDCDGCNDVRVVVTIEEHDRKGEGLVAHLGGGAARRLRAAIATALRELGEDPGT